MTWWHIGVLVTKTGFDPPGLLYSDSRILCPALLPIVYTLFSCVFLCWRVGSESPCDIRKDGQKLSVWCRLVSGLLYKTPPCYDVLEMRYLWAANGKILVFFFYSTGSEDGIVVWNYSHRSFAWDMDNRLKDLWIYEKRRTRWLWGKFREAS